MQMHCKGVKSLVYCYREMNLCFRLEASEGLQQIAYRKLMLKQIAHKELVSQSL